MRAHRGPGFSRASFFRDTPSGAQSHHVREPPLTSNRKSLPAALSSSRCIVVPASVVGSARAHRILGVSDLEQVDERSRPGTARSSIGRSLLASARRQTSRCRNPRRPIRTAARGTTGRIRRRQLRPPEARIRISCASESQYTFKPEGRVMTHASQRIVAPGERQQRAGSKRQRTGTGRRSSASAWPMTSSSGIGIARHAERIELFARPELLDPLPRGRPAREDAVGGGRHLRSVPAGVRQRARRTADQSCKVGLKM